MRNPKQFALTGATKALLVGFGLLTTILWTAVPLRADVFGTILGTVTDATGAVVPGAKVILRNGDTGLVREVATDASGYYEFLAVPVGEKYSVGVEGAGFKKSAQSGIKLLVNQRFRADFKLEVGTVKQEVNVAANVAQVETVSTQIGDVIEDKKIQDVPLNGRSYLDLMGLQAGVVPTATNGTGQPISGELTAGTLSVNGQRENANSFNLNGGPVEEVYYNGAAISPTLDSIQEFKILTNSFDAEYGQFSGGIVNAVTKSGTNAFHGTAFEFLRNSDLDSRNFFDRNQTSIVTGQEIPGSAIGQFRRNQFGGVVGGPILKNRFFFFVDYQGTREAIGSSTGTLAVPSALERAGNFSDVGTTGYSALTGTVRGDNNPADGAMPTYLTNALGYTVTGGEPYWVPGCNTLANAQAGMCVFPNQTIPMTAWSPVAKKELGFIPPPTGTLGSGQPFYSTSALNTTTTDDKWGSRIDWNNKRTGNWAFYYNYDKASVINPYNSASFPGFTASTPSKSQYFNMSNTHIFGPTAVNELRLTFTRVAYTPGQPLEGLGAPGTFGFQTSGLGLIPEEAPSVMGVPHVALDNLGISFGASVPEIENQNHFSISEGFSKITGKHTLKIGFRGEDSEWAIRGNCCDNGTFTFEGGETGNDFADFLLGAPDAFSQSGLTAEDSRTKSVALYGQDSYRVKSNLTLNYGLRWETGEPWYDTQNRLQAFVPGLQSTIFPNSPRGWVFPNDPGVPRTLAPIQYHDFAPRVGIAYSPAASEGVWKKIFGGPGMTSIRAGGGIFFTSFDSRWQSWEDGDPPFGSYWSSPVPVYLAEPYKSRINGNDPGQRYPAPRATKDVSFATFLPLEGAGYQTTNTTPYSENFNVTVQRELGATSILTIGYVGSRGHHLFDFLDNNPGNIAKCVEIANLFNAAGQPGNGCGPFGEDSIYTIDGQTFNGTRPYSVTSGQYLGQGELDFSDGNWESTLGNSNYNALQVTFNKTKGPQNFLAAYTYSKSLDNASSDEEWVNPYNAKVSKGLSTFDMTHNFVFSYSVELPLHHLTHSQTGVVHGIVSGWTLAGITRFTTGVPIAISESGDRSLCGCDEGGSHSSVDFPNYNDQPIQTFNPRTQTKYQYFSTANFSEETLGVPGDSNRSFFHGPGLNNWDASLFKNVRITERVSLDIRAEFFNVFNHAQFSGPNGNFSSSNFGRVTSAAAPRIGQVAMKIHF